MAKYIDENVAQKIANDIQKNRVLLGAFDTVDTSNANYNLITRRTGYVDLGKFTWVRASTYGFYSQEALPNFTPTAGLDDIPPFKCSLYKTGTQRQAMTGGNEKISYVNNSGQLVVATSLYTDVASFVAYIRGCIAQYQLNTQNQYTEKVIKGVPILNLDQNGANWLRSEWEKGLNLFDVSNYAYDGDSYRYFKVKISKLGTYYLSSTISPVRFELYQNGSKIFDFTENHSFTLTSSNFDLTKTLDIYVSDNDGDYSVNANSVMLNEGDHPYPYQPYSGAIVHKKEIENVAYKNVNNEFSSNQRITSSTNSPLELRSGSSQENQIAFKNSSSTYIGSIGIYNKKPRFWSADESVKPSGAILVEDDIAELKSIVYDNQYPAVATIKNNTYFAIPNSIDGDKLIHSVGMDMTNIDGMSVVVNQWLTYVEYDYSVSIGSNGYGNFNSVSASKLVIGHKYLLCNNSTWTDTNIEEIGAYFGSGDESVATQSSGALKLAIVNMSNADIAFFRVYATINTTVNFHFKGFAIDLTQWFGSNDNIPSDLLSNPSLFTSKYWKGSLAYDTGHIESAKPKAVVSYGFNIWDEEWQNGYWGQSGFTSDSRFIGNKNHIKVNPNTTYFIQCPNTPFEIWFYDKDFNYISMTTKSRYTFDTPSNCSYICFNNATANAVTTYNHDICINLSSSMNETYLPHIAPKRYLINVGNNNSINGVNTIKDIMGVLNTNRKIGKVDLGTLTFTKELVSSGTVTVFLTTGINSVIASYTKNIMCSKGYVVAPNNPTMQQTDKSMIVEDMHGYGFYIHDSAYDNMTAEQFKEAMSGQYLYYELATPYTEQNPQDANFPTDIEIQKGGSLEIESDLPCDITFEVAVSKVY